MGTHAHATLIFGYAWEPEECPSPWSDGYGGVEANKLPVELQEIWDDEEHLGETLSELIRVRGWDLLGIARHGNFEGGWVGSGITVKRLGFSGSIGEIRDLPDELGRPNAAELLQLKEAGKELGFDIGEAGWKFLVDYS